MHTNFMIDCLNRNAKIDDLEQYVEYWHTHETGNSLKVFLGMSDSEYERWGKTSDAAIEQFLSERKNRYMLTSVCINEREMIRRVFGMFTGDVDQLSLMELPGLKIRESTKDFKQKNK